MKFIITKYSNEPKTETFIWKKNIEVENQYFTGHSWPSFSGHSFKPQFIIKKRYRVYKSIAVGESEKDG